MRTATAQFVEVQFVPGGFAHTTDSFLAVYSVEPGSVHQHFISEVSSTGKSFRFWTGGASTTTWRAVRHWKLFIVKSAETFA